MQDIGSIFPIYDSDLAFESNDTINYNYKGRVDFSLCREALYAIAKKHYDSNKKVLIPAYTCQTVIDPFVDQGWTCIYYNIGRDLRIDLQSLIHIFEKEKPAIVIVHPYLGMELNREEIGALTSLRNQGCILVKDLTQCIFSKNKENIFNYFIGSYRKWINVPDGGFLEGSNIDGICIPEIDYQEFVNKQTDAMYLRGVYFQNSNEQLKAISIRLYKDAVNSINIGYHLHRMSDISHRIWNNANLKYVQEKRISNYLYLHKNIRESEQIQLITTSIEAVSTAPLYFPIYVRERSRLQSLLARNHIYAPVLWPVQTEEVLINDGIKFIYDSILMLPIDQRYDTRDMNRIIDIVNSYE